jgi:hypothetical protein
MKILVACEESQEVTKAFRARGHEAYSCDIQECSGGHPEWHIQDDIIKVLKMESTKGDILISHPPCTRLTNSVIWYIKKYNLYNEVDQAAEFALRLLNCNKFKTRAMENPIPHGYAQNLLGKYSQKIQPYNFGENASKETCLWLRGLPKLINTGYFPARIVDGKNRWGNQTDSGQNKLPPSLNRAKLRSKTYPEIAKAMAEQWG